MRKLSGNVELVHSLQRHLTAFFSCTTITLCMSIFIPLVHPFLTAPFDSVHTYQGNILIEIIDNRPHVRLTYFGLSNFADTSQCSASAALPGAHPYMAPEIITPPKGTLLRHTKASDIYSYGRVCEQVRTA